MTSTFPAASAGEVAVHKTAEEQLTAVPAVSPKLAVVAPVTKPVPVMDTAVPAVSGPADGLMALTVGTAS